MKWQVIRDEGRVRSASIAVITHYLLVPYFTGITYHLGPSHYLGSIRHHLFNRVMECDKWQV